MTSSIAQHRIPRDRAAWFVLAVSVLVYSTAAAVSTPNLFPDSGGYLGVAEALRHGDWDYREFCYRTPGYPLYLAAVQCVFGNEAYRPMMIGQFLIAMALPPMLYAILKQITRRRWAAAAGALTPLLDHYVVGVPSVILTEFFSMMVAAASVLAYIYGSKRLTWKTAVLVGAVFGYTALVRPSFTVLGLLATLGALAVRLTYPALRTRFRSFLLWHAGMITVAWLVTVPWRALLWWRHGHFVLGFIFGVTLSNQAAPIMDKAPEQYREIRDLFQQLRNSNVTGSYIDTGWGVLWEYERRTGRPHTDAAQKLADVSVALLARHPVFYARQIADGFWLSWTNLPAYVTDETDLFRTKAPARVTNYARFASSSPVAGPVYRSVHQYFWSRQELLIICPVLILLLAGIATYRLRKRPSAVIALWMLLGTAYYHILVHSATNFTEFGRYRLPAHPLWEGFLGLVAMRSLIAAWDATRLRITNVMHIYRTR